MAKEKMQRDINLPLIFSRRRASLFKKANELSILCGAKVAVIAFSPTNKAYSFGAPNLDAVIGVFMGQDWRVEPEADQVKESGESGVVREMDSRMSYFKARLEEERRRGHALDQMRAANRRERWWDAPIEEMNMEQLALLQASLEELKKLSLEEKDRLEDDEAASSLCILAQQDLPPPPPFHLGSSSSGSGSGGPTPFTAAGPGSSGYPGASSSAGPIGRPGFRRGNRA
ncbi:agamous-like MADS-box protein AGL62 [Diospyros lotus]|uniref:agamous-like MADS-box protein AGL62 n=1 Tax=Diospyros lotus TaxID=55363 RepID=UPI00225768F9|nr:agamous-like MADS-box protein AGL62 [Diospyros lotus]